MSERLRADLSRITSFRDFEKFLSTLHSRILDPEKHPDLQGLYGSPTIGAFDDWPDFIPPQPRDKSALLAYAWDTFVADREVDPLGAHLQLGFSLVAIHPFSDGNGRTSRILIDPVLPENLRSTGLGEHEIERRLDPSSRHTPVNSWVWYVLTQGKTPTYPDDWQVRLASYFERPAQLAGAIREHFGHTTRHESLETIIYASVETGAKFLKSAAIQAGCDLSQMQGQPDTVNVGRRVVGLMEVLDYLAETDGGLDQVATTIDSTRREFVRTLTRMLSLGFTDKILKSDGTPITPLEVLKKRYIARLEELQK